MDKLVAALPTFLAVNGTLDVIFGVTGIMDSVLANGAFKDFSSPHKDIVISTFSTSFVIHGLVRLFALRNMNVDAFKHLSILSFVVEMLQAIRLIRAGAIGPRDSGPFILGPLIATLVLLSYKNEPKNS